MHLTPNKKAKIRDLCEYQIGINTSKCSLMALKSNIVSCLVIELLRYIIKLGSVDKSFYVSSIYFYVKQTEPSIHFISSKDAFQS